MDYCTIMSALVTIKKPLVSVNWLCQHLDATNLLVFNGTIPKSTAKKEMPFLETTQIPNARFFDLEKVFSIQDAAYPNTSLEPQVFEAKARELGINNDTCIVVYDEHGIYSSPRVWCLFRTMGFDNIAVLDGGFPAWKLAGNVVEQKVHRAAGYGNFEVRHRTHLFVDTTEVLKALSDRAKQLIDARTSGRFYASEAEPRQDLRSGHIPTSKRLPYAGVLERGEFKSVTVLRHLFHEIGAANKVLIFSCGSGITACVLALGAALAGYENIAVYDGSWSEWGSKPELPIETV